MMHIYNGNGLDVNLNKLQWSGYWPDLSFSSSSSSSSSLSSSSVNWLQINVVRFFDSHFVCISNSIQTCLIVLVFT